MREVAISEFKARCLALLEQVAKTRQPLRVTRFGRPVAEVFPPSQVQGRAAWIGSMRDSIEILGDIISPAAEESEWEALGE